MIACVCCVHLSQAKVGSGQAGEHEKSYFTRFVFPLAEMMPAQARENTNSLVGLRTAQAGCSLVVFFGLAVCKSPIFAKQVGARGDI